MPQQFSNVPKELAITPLPTPLITPPVTKIYFIVCGNWCLNVLMKRLHINLIWCVRCFVLVLSQCFKSSPLLMKNNIFSLFLLVVFLIQVDNMIWHSTEFETMRIGWRRKRKLCWIQWKKTIESSIHWGRTTSMNCTNATDMNGIAQHQRIKITPHVRRPHANACDSQCAVKC